MKKNYGIYIAIDPDVSKSGVCYLDKNTRKFEASAMSFVQLLDYLQHVKKQAENAEIIGDIVVVVEAGWLNQSHWHVKSRDNARVAAAKGNNAGRNHETGRKIIEVAKHYGFAVIEQRPLRKCWQGADGKITHNELSSFTGLIQKTSQDVRDAILLAWVCAELPIKLKKS